MFRADLTAISDYLGEKPYLLGDQMCLADLTLFSFVCMIKILPEDSNSRYKLHVEDNCQNLLAHHQRIVEQYWPDYESCRFGMEEELNMIE